MKLTWTNITLDMLHISLSLTVCYCDTIWIILIKGTYSHTVFFCIIIYSLLQLWLACYTATYLGYLEHAILHCWCILWKMIRALLERVQISLSHELLISLVMKRACSRRWQCNICAHLSEVMQNKGTFCTNKWFDQGSNQLIWGWKKLNILSNYVTMWSKTCCRVYSYE